MTPRARAGIVLTAEDTSGAGFSSFRRNLAGVQAEVATVGDKLSGLSARAGAVGAALGAALAVGATVKGAIDLGDQLDDLSEKTGIAVSELSALRYAGEVTGTPLEALAGGVKKLATTMFEAAGGAKEQGKLFDALGISVKNLDGTLKGSDQVLGEIADKFASFEDGPAKAALAVKIFGKAGADMIPLLNQGSRGIAELRKEAEQLGAVVGEDFARQSAAFNDNLKKIELTVEGTKRGIAEALLPTLNTLAEAFLEARDGSSSFAEIFGGSVRTALQAGTVLLANVSFVLKGVGREIGALAAQAVALATLDIDGFNAISEAVKEDGIRARKELDDLERRILQTGNSLAGAGRGTAPDPRALGPVGSIREQTRGWRQAAPVVDSSDKVSKEISAYERISKAIAERIALMDKELALGRTLTEQEKFELKVLDDITAAKKKISAAEVARIKNTLEEAKAKALQLEIERAQLKAAQDAAAERQRLRIQDDRQVKEYLQDQERAAAQQLASLRERVAGVKDETEAADLAARANIGLAEAVEQVAIARLQERLARLHEDGDEAQRVRDEIAERQRLIGVLRTQRIGEQARDTIKETQEESKRFFESIYDGLSDSLFRGFEAGKGFFRSFWDGVKNTLKTTVLRVAVQGIMGMTPLAALSGQSGSGGVGVVNGLSAASNLWSAGASVATVGSQVIGGTMSVANAAGTLAANATGTGISGLLATNGAYGTAVGAGGVTGIMGGVQAALAAIPVWGWAAMAALAIFGMSKKGGGPKLDGVYGQIGSDLGKADNSLLPTVRPVVEGLQTQYDALNKLLGGAGGIRFGLGVSTDPKGTSPTFLDIGASRDGEQLFSNLNRTVGRSEDDLKQAMAVGVTDALIGALARSDLDKPFADYFAAVATDASQEAKQAAIATASNVAAYSKPLADLGGVFAQLATVSVTVRDGMIQAAGGLEALSAATNTYYENFYSDEERRVITIGRIGDAFEQVGLSLDGIDLSAGSARQAFRAIVDGLDLSTEAGQKQFTVLMSVAGAFASITPVAENAAEAIADIAETLEEAIGRLRNPQRSVEDIARGIISLEDERSSLQVELRRASGDELGARQWQRAIDTAGFTDAEIAIYDYNQALRDQIQVLTDAAEAALQVAAERAGLEQQLLQLQGNTTELRRRELAALAPANRALQEMITPAWKRRLKYEGVRRFGQSSWDAPTTIWQPNDGQIIPAQQLEAA